jgi:hypothetical protein
MGSVAWHTASMTISDPAASAAGGAGIGVLILLLIVVGASAYFVPTIIALIRKTPNTGSVIAINLLLGWSLIGWAVALAMALRDQRAPTVVINQGFVPGPGSGQQPMYQQPTYHAPPPVETGPVPPAVQPGPVPPSLARDPFQVPGQDHP